MADKVLLASRSDQSHSFLNAMWIAGFLAVVQLVAVVVALIKTSPEEDKPVVTTMPPVMRVPADNEVVASVESRTEVVPKPEPKVSNPIELEPTPVAVTNSSVRRLPAPDLSEVMDPVGLITDSLIARLVESGVDDRRRGEYQNALEAFLDANRNLPDHPRILCEIAGTYGEIGQLEKATEFWNQVAAKGQIAGGPFYQVAIKMLRGEDPSIPEVEEGKFMKVGKVKVRKQPITNEGEWVSLSIPIVGRRGVTLSGGDMDIRVYFYDLINGANPGQTTATITYDFPTQPLDWKDNRTEEIEFIYHQPVFTLEQKQRLGERVYFGYVIELYYQNQLQDSVVSSDELRSLRFPASPQVVEEPPAPQGPDASLFPINR